ncbi:MAG TPA: hypothetical protein ENN56_00880, partial [Firmicutes bacterium]|nr:hypothetical protein [Bacillota bacterium]
MADRLAIFKRRVSWSSPILFVASFFVMIVIGAVLLSLPFATVSRGSMSLVDALFQSTSAVCITGLTTLTVATDLTLFGQIVILVLFQAGALGI